MRKAIVAAGAILGLAALGYAAAWFHGASRLEQGVAAWKAEAERNGLTVTHGPVRIGGFPLALRATVPDLSIRNEAEAARLEAAPVTLTTTLWSPDRVAYDFSGPHALVVGEGPKRLEAMLDVGAGSGVALLSPEGRRDQLSVRDLRIFGEAGYIRIGAVEAKVYAARSPSDGSAETVRATYVLTDVEASSRVGAKLFQPPIGLVRLELAATGPFLEIFEDGSLVDWAEAGGIVSLRDLTLEWNGLTVTATGSGRFDAELRPSGALTLVSSGFVERLEELERDGTMPVHIARIVRALTERFILPAMGAGKSQLIVPVTAADGLLSIGDEPLAPVPSLNRL
jgi:hypothetical protein